MTKKSMLPEPPPPPPPPPPELSNIATSSRNGHNHISNNIKAPKVVVLFAAAALVCLFLRDLTSSLQWPTQNKYFPFGAGSGVGDQSKNPNDLESILKNAAMNDKTVIISPLNKAWAEPNSVFDLLLESFRTGNQTQRLLKHLVVINLDQHAYARCTQIHPHCYALDTNGTDFSGVANFMKPNYLDMVWCKIKILASVLELGYNFIFTDTDVMWFRDPFPHFHADADFQISCDRFNGKALDLNNWPNSGFKFVKSNNKTVEFYKFWYASKEKYPGIHDQDALNKIKFDPFVNQIGLQIRFLDTAYFGGFCAISKDLNKVCTMHANCCVGMGNKIFDLQIMLDDWRKYMSSQMNDTAPRHSSWTVPQHCGLSSSPSRPSQKKVIKNISANFIVVRIHGFERLRFLYSRIQKTRAFGTSWFV